MSSNSVCPTFRKVLVASAFGACVFMIPNGVHSATSNSATLQWAANQESDLAGYRVYHGTTSGNYGGPHDAGKTPSYQYTNLEPNKTHYFSVTAYDTSGNESPPGLEVFKTVISSGGGDTPVAAWTAAGQNPGGTLTNSTFDNRSFRVLLKGVVISTSGSTVQLTLRGRSSGSYTMQNLSLVQRDGSTLNGVDSTFQAVTFNSGASSVTVPAGGTVTSDPIPFDLIAGQDVFLTFWAPSGAPGVYLTGGTQATAWFINETDQSGTIDWKGLTISDTRAYIYNIELVEVLAEQQRVAEAEALQEQQRVAEAEALQEQQRVAEAEALQEQQRVAEAEALQEQQRVAEAEALQEQQRVAEAEALQEQQRVAEAVKLQEQQRVAEAFALENSEPSLPKPNLPILVNFQPTASQVPTNFKKDDGNVFTSTRGYGWNKLLNGMEKNSTADQTLDTFVSASNQIPSTWNFRIPNGIYYVTMVLGDPKDAQGPHWVSVEGFQLAKQVNTAGGEYLAIVDYSVEVKDSTLSLTLGNSGQGQTTLNYLAINEKPNLSNVTQILTQSFGTTLVTSVLNSGEATKINPVVLVQKDHEEKDLQEKAIAQEKKQQEEIAIARANKKKQKEQEAVAPKQAQAKQEAVALKQAQAKQQKEKEVVKLNKIKEKISSMRKSGGTVSLRNLFGGSR